MLCQFHAHIYGKVQGVYFRWSTREEARRLGVTGWVRNRPDGSVEALFQGPTEAVQAMLAWCGHGPSNARVDNVQVQESTLEQGETPLKGFTILE